MQTKTRKKGREGWSWQLIQMKRKVGEERNVIAAIMNDEVC